MKNSLKAIILGTVIGLTSCAPSIYDYKGKIGNDLISCEDEYSFWRGLDHFVLIVKKEDGREIRYYDKSRDQKLDSVVIKKNGKSYFFAEEDKIGAEAFKIAEKQYTDYLAKILEAKNKEALELIIN